MANGPKGRGPIDRSRYRLSAGRLQCFAGLPAFFRVPQRNSQWLAMIETIRLSKYLADHLSCSRREAENYVQGGWVRVDGQLIEEPGFRLQPQNRVELAEGASAQDHKPATILLHKPVGYGSKAGERSIFDLIASANRASDDRNDRTFVKRDLNGLELMTPLEADAAGLVVFTQEYSVARKLNADAASIEHEYVAEVAGEIAVDGLKRLNHGLSWRGTRLPPVKVSWQNETHLRFALKNPPAGLILDMCHQVGLKIISLKRLRIGRVSLSGLVAGQWRYLMGYERF